MLLIRCTKKLQKEIGLTESDLIKTEPASSILGSWHANLIYIDGKKCALFVNDKTLFNFIIPDISRKQLRDIFPLFKTFLQCVIADEGLPESITDKIISEYDSISFANTNSKSILGSMNDLASHYKFFILDQGGVHSPAVPGIIKRLNHWPFSSLQFVYPIDALKAIYETAT